MISDKWRQTEDNWYILSRPHIKIHVFKQAGAWRLSCQEAGFSHFPLKAGTAVMALNEGLSKVKEKIRLMLKELSE